MDGTALSNLLELAETAAGLLAEVRTGEDFEVECHDCSEKLRKATKDVIGSGTAGTGGQNPPGLPGA